MRKQISPVEIRELILNCYTIYFLLSCMSWAGLHRREVLNDVLKWSSKRCLSEILCVALLQKPSLEPCWYLLKGFLKARVMWSILALKISPAVSVSPSYPQKTFQWTFILKPLWEGRQGTHMWNIIMTIVKLIKWGFIQCPNMLENRWLFSFVKVS